MSKKQKVSDWQPANTKPTISGIYETRETGRRRWRYWHNGIGCWNVQRYSFLDPEFKRDRAFPFCSAFQTNEWRGVIE